VWLEGLGKLKKINDFIGNQTRDSPASSICLNQLHYRVPHDVKIQNEILCICVPTEKKIVVSLEQHLKLIL
jgi:hypothetical protein